MRSLVIGAGGFVGRYLVRHLIDEGDEVIGTLHGENRGDLLCETVSVDVTDATRIGEILLTAKPEVVYLLAGIAFVPEAESDLEKTLRVNVAGAANVARQCRLLGSNPRLLFVSSAEVYGHVRSEELPVSEENPLRPANNYSLSKRMAELVVERYARQGGVRVAVARPFNHIGPGQDPRFVASNFALQLARVAHGLTPGVLEVGNLEAKRDFSDVRDIVRAYRILARDHEGVFNLGSGRSYSIRELLELLIEISGCQVSIRQDPSRTRGPEVAELYGSNKRVEAACGWTPGISLRQSLEDTYRFWFDTVASEVKGG
jgi:GDP-4-dehydro-6-deoxy-D-mannose reductase